AAARRRRTAPPRILAATIDLDSRVGAAEVFKPSTDSVDGTHVKPPTGPSTPGGDAAVDDPLFVVVHAGRRSPARLDNSLAVLLQSVLDTTSHPVELVILTSVGHNVDPDAWAE